MLFLCVLINGYTPPVLEIRYSQSRITKNNIKSECTTYPIMKKQKFDALIGPRYNQVTTNANVMLLIS